jgi:hypothetical protein
MTQPGVLNSFVMDSIVLAIISATIAATLTTIIGLWVLRRTGRQPSTSDVGTTRRMARDLVVISELLADQLAKIWKSDGDPAPNAADHDTVFHHVRESTETIIRRAGASEKTALAVGALTAKRVRPGPITQLDGHEPRAPGPDKGSS